MTEQAKKTPAWLVACRHIVAMMIVGLAYRDIYYHPLPIQTWMVGWLGSLIISLFFLALYALFFTNNAKRNWKKFFFGFAWFLLVMVILQPWLKDLNALKQKANVNDIWWEDSPLVHHDNLQEPNNKPPPEDLFEKYGIEQKSK